MRFYSVKVAICAVTLGFFGAYLASVSPGVLAYTSGFQRTLRLGSSGEDVRELQKVLNADPYTRVQEVGPGSPGQETAYFGQFTHEAVIRFQEKHGARILTPNGLSAGTGFVGAATIPVLSEIRATVEAGSGSVSVASPPSPNTSTNPNLVGIERFLSAIDSVSAQEGLPASEIATIKSQVMKDVATTTNLWEKFIGVAEENAKDLKNLSEIDENVFSGAASWIFANLNAAFGVKDASAQATVPFGGRLLYPFYCTCSFNWLITLTPLPPSYAVLLSYYPFSQVYLSYNIPFTTSLLGRYTPAAGYCLVYAGVTCIPIPSQGLITPIVGSSAF